MSDVLHSADDPDALKDGVRHFHVVTEDSTMVALTQQMSAVQHNYDNSLVDATNNVNWFSDTPAVATVDSAGLVTAHSAGSSIITCEKPQSIIRASPTTITAPASLFSDCLLGTRLRHA
jgi:transglutaminase/protease-like cytokinesis protein 3